MRVINPVSQSGSHVMQSLARSVSHAVCVMHLSIHPSIAEPIFLHAVKMNQLAHLTSRLFGKCHAIQDRLQPQFKQLGISLQPKCPSLPLI